MKVWKQLVLGVAALAGSTAVAVRFVPGADKVFLNAGLPQGLISMLAPAADGEAMAATAPHGQAAQGGARRGSATVLVTTAPVATGIVNDKLEAIGDGLAIKSVTVMPAVSGPLASVEIESGAKVESGTIVARLDDASEKIAVSSAMLALAAAEEKADRYKGLQSVTRVERDDALRAVDEARLALDTAELNLQRRLITAPIGGIAGIVSVNPGDNVTTQTEIVALDDRSEILVDFWVPERFASAIKVGAPVDASAIARPGKPYTGTVAAIDSRIDSASRTIRVRARIPNADDELRAGMSFTVSMKFAGETYPAVDPLSVQWDSKGSYVWRLNKDKAERVPVRIVQRNPENVLVEGALKAGDPVISEGMQRVRPGAQLTVAGAKPAVQP